MAIKKHKYLVAGGSYDSYWLVEADGKEIGKVGDSKDDAVRNLSGN